MLSMRDCLDYCNLTDDEIDLIAEHEGIPDVVAAQMACGLVQTDEGTLLLARCMESLLERAEAAGQIDKLQRAKAAYAQFIADHPVPH